MGPACRGRHLLPARHGSAVSPGKQRRPPAV